MQLLDSKMLKRIPKMALPKLIATYENSTLLTLSELPTYLQEGDSTAIAASVRRLKGASMTIGAVRVAAICDELQKKSKDQDISGISKSIAELTMLSRESIEELKIEAEKIARAETASA